MILDISKILLTKGEEVPFYFEEELCFDNFNGQRELCFNKPAKFSGTIENVSGILYMSGKLEASVDLKCDRCGQNIENEYMFLVEEAFSSTEAVDDEEIRHIKGKQVDLSPILREAMLMQLPTKILCDNDCKGLCDCCGANLNNESCECNTEKINPAFASLKNLKFD
ncbi:MAG: DUF177 domain-containing protein [Clostridia bacterium]|jgi:uncharacterized protein|nr:DUF177 domain-containing protein [Clostridia bacterium]